jgi:hypothetical protein
MLMDVKPRQSSVDYANFFYHAFVVLPSLQIEHDFRLLYPDATDKMASIWPEMCLKILQQKITDKQILKSVNDMLKGEGDQQEAPLG